MKPTRMTKKRHSYWILLGALGTFALLPTLAEAQVRREQQPKRLHPKVIFPSAPQRPLQPPRDAIKLLNGMYSPKIVFSGEEQTFLPRNNGITSQQKIIGDPKGRVIRRYLSPEQLKGDIMLIAPNRFVYYHAKDNTLEDTTNDVSEPEYRKVILKGLRDRTFVANHIGNAVVAGKPSIIIEVRPNDPMSRAKATFWINPFTNIKLKHEIYDNNGNLASRSELLSVAFGPTAGVTEKDFFPPEFETKKDTARRRRFRTIEEARKALPFTPYVPDVLPTGFRFSQVVLIDQAAFPMLGGSVTVHYTDSVTSIHIVQRMLKNNLQRPGFSRNARTRIITTPSGSLEVTVRGNVTPQQVQTIHDSLRAAW